MQKYNDWLEHPVTKEYFEKIKEKRDALLSSWVIPVHDHSPEQIGMQHAVRMGIIEGLEFVTNIQFLEEE